MSKTIALQNAYKIISHNVSDYSIIHRIKRGFIVCNVCEHVALRVRSKLDLFFDVKMRATAKGYAYIIGGYHAT